MSDDFDELKLETARALEAAAIARASQWWNGLRVHERQAWLDRARRLGLPDSVAGAWAAYCEYELELAALEL